MLQGPADDFEEPLGAPGLLDETEARSESLELRTMTADASAKSCEGAQQDGRKAPSKLRSGTEFGYLGISQ